MAVSTGRKTDRRTLYTKNVIRAAFLCELKGKEYNKITVTDICKRAEINRSTFYLHYVDAVAVFDELLDELLAELTAAMDEVSYPNGSLEDYFGFSEGLYQQIMRHEAKVFLLQKGFAYPAFTERFAAGLAKKLAPRIPTRGKLAQGDLALILTCLMYGYVQIDLHTLKTHSVAELERFNQLLNRYIVAPCMEKLMD